MLWAKRSSVKQKSYFSFHALNFSLESSFPLRTNFQVFRIFVTIIVRMNWGVGRPKTCKSQRIHQRQSAEQQRQIYWNTLREAAGETEDVYGLRSSSGFLLWKGPLFYKLFSWTFMTGESIWARYLLGCLVLSVDVWHRTCLGLAFASRSQWQVLWFDSHGNLINSLYPSLPNLPASKEWELKSLTLLNKTLETTVNTKECFYTAGATK